MNDATLKPGTGNFFVNKSEEDTRWVQVFYNTPAKIDSATKVLIVLPGAGRDGDQYIDAWYKVSELKNVIVLALKYPAETYDFGRYHMAGMIENVTFEEDFKFVQNGDPSVWIFHDFDRIFEMVVTANSLNATSYDIFGHSAGGADPSSIRTI